MILAAAAADPPAEPRGPVAIPAADCILQPGTLTILSFPGVSGSREDPMIFDLPDII